MPEHSDQETRERLLATATRLFAEHGFDAVTVRDICELAKANVAAVNYHFGGKAGLYDEVMQSAIRIMQTTTEEARRLGARKRPVEQLRAYVHVFITRVAAGSAGTWIHQLMMREMANPTPALDKVIDQVIRPRMAFLSGIVAELAGRPPDDARVMSCAFSVQAQCVALINQRIAERVNPALALTPDRIEATIDHITRFSRAGIADVRVADPGTIARTAQVPNPECRIPSPGLIWRRRCWRWPLRRTCPTRGSVHTRRPGIGPGARPARGD